MPRLRGAAWLAIAAAACTVGYLLLARRFWPAEILCHFRPQLGGLILCGAIAALALRLWVQGALLACIALFSAWPTLALWVPRSERTGPRAALRVASVNLLWGSDSFGALERWLEAEAPEVVFVCEIDAERRQRLEELRERGYPYQLLAPPPQEWGAATWGRALIARRPLADGRVHWPGPILEAWIAHEGRELRILGAHPVRPGRAEMTHRRNMVLEALGRMAGECAGVVVLGDLNVTESTPRYGALLAAGGLRDTRAGRGAMGTWRVTVPRVRWRIPRLRLPLDHVLIGAELVALERGLGPDIGSDHLPVLADVAWR